MKLEGAYKFIILKRGDYYIAKGELPDGSGQIVTQGKENEIFYMIGDAYTALAEIKVGWWHRFLAKFLR